jgi:hypothetical protein
LGWRSLRFAGVIMLMGVIVVMTMVMIMFVAVVMIVRMFMIVMIMMFGMGVVLFGVMRMDVAILGLAAFEVLMRLGDLRGIRTCVLDDVALDAVAAAAAARIAVARTPAAVAGAVFGFFLGLAMGALVGLDQRLAIGDRNLIIVGVDFAEGQEAVTVAAILDKGRLQ